jgi:hypothetical protein
MPRPPIGASSAKDERLNALACERQADRRAVARAAAECAGRVLGHAGAQGDDSA